MTHLTRRLETALGNRYTIECELGRGAMGVVYRARDRQLDRAVALKVLFHDGAGVDEVLARFGREARVLASINTPSIAAIHGYEVAGDTHVLVLELIEGLTLHERLEQGPMPLDEVIAVCADIAAALKSAHDLGIIHCDLKPENVKITSEGVVKVLDFGIAVRMRTSSGRLSRPQIPTPQIEATPARRSVHSDVTEEQPQAGSGEPASSAQTLAGTPPYMSPEQVLREPLSNRTDNWAFGCLLFECLAGKSPFARRTAPETFMAIVGGEPDWTALPRRTPQRLRDLLRRCLEKNPTDRLPDISDARHELQLTGLETSPDRPAVKLPNHNLPTGRASFIGRMQETENIAAVLTRTHLATITGPGGSGKTLLATEVGYQLLERFADGVWLFELTPDIDPPPPRVLAAALGLSADSTAELVQALQPKQLLLILDAGEQALSACADLASRLLSDCPSLSILAVGKTGLGLVGEASYAVPPLEWPASSTPATLDVLHGVESVQLFVVRARSCVPAFELTDKTAATVEAICRTLCGFPLGIELAAAQVKGLPLDRLARMLAQELEPHANRRPTVSRFDQAARGVIAWAMRRLAEHEVTLLRRLAVFTGGWTMEAARAVCEGDGVADVFGVLARLTELSFVYVENRGDQTRYRMPNAIRERARELLRESSDYTVTRRRHCEFFLALAERAEPVHSGSEHAVWHGRREADAANLRTAFAFAGDAEHPDDLWAQFESVQQETLFRRLSVFPGGWTVAAAEAICGGDGVAGIPGLLDQLVERSLVVARERDDELRYDMPAFLRRRGKEGMHAAGEATAIGRRYRAFFLKLAEDGRDGLSGPGQAAWLRRLEADHVNLRDAAGSYLDPDEADESLRFIAALSRFWEISGRLDEGRRLTDSVISAFATSADPEVTANALAGAARLAVRAGELVAAQASLERADRLFRAAGERAGIAEVLNAQANVALRRGDYSGARALCEESLNLYRKLGDTRGTAWALLTLGEVAYRNGDYTGSLGLREEALALFREADDRRGLAWALTNVGKSAIRRGDFAAAQARHAESLAIHLELGDRPGTAWSLSSLAHVALAGADFREAGALLEESLVLSRQTGNLHGVAWSLLQLANVAYFEGKVRTACSLSMEALALFRQLQVDGGRAWCLVALGNFARRRGKLRSAHVLLVESLTAFTKLGEKRGVASALRGCSLLAAAVGEPYGAAQLLGAAELLGDEMGEKLIPPEQREIDGHVDLLRHALGRTQFASALDWGRALSPTEAVGLSLRRPASIPSQGSQVRSA